MFYSGFCAFVSALTIEHLPNPQNEFLSFVISLARDSHYSTFFFTNKCYDHQCILISVAIIIILPPLNYVSYPLWVGFTYSGCVFFSRETASSFPARLFILQSVSHVPSQESRSIQLWVIS